MAQILRSVYDIRRTAQAMREENPDDPFMQNVADMLQTIAERINDNWRAQQSSQRGRRNPYIAELETMALALVSTYDSTEVSA